MKTNDYDRFCNDRKNLLDKWHNPKYRGRIENYRNDAEFSSWASYVKNRDIPYAENLVALKCPQCNTVYSDVNDYRYILEYCDDCSCDLEYTDDELI